MTDRSFLKLLKFELGEIVNSLCPNRTVQGPFAAVGIRPWSGRSITSEMHDTPQRMPDGLPPDSDRLPSINGIPRSHDRLFGTGHIKYLGDTGLFVCIYVAKNIFAQL